MARAAAARWLGLIALAVALWASLGPAEAAGYSAIVIDAETGAVLEQHNADMRTYPASLTKMMTLYMVFEALEAGRITLKKPIPVSRHAAGQAPSKLGLVPGQSITVEQAILALVTKSANDAAAAIAEKVGGSEYQFAQMMTTRARALGMKNTTFRNASGLHHASQVTTARDMATLGRALMRDFPQYYHYFSKTGFSYRGRHVANHNTLLRSYRGADGIKTGYIRAAGYNLAASAIRDGRRVIGIVLGGNSPRSRNVQMASLLDRGFKQQVQVAKGPKPTATALAALPPLPDLKPEIERIEIAALPTLSPTLAEAVDEGDSVDEPQSDAFETGTEPWSIQVGAFTRREAAERATLAAVGAIPQILTAARPTVMEVATDSATIYRARLTGLTEAQARQACRHLHEQLTACLAVRPGGLVEVAIGQN